jgi:tetratricopeptide (TPR) repeat protein
MKRAFFVGVLLAASATRAFAQPASSPHEAAATAAYDAGDLDTALREFEAAYADTQRPDLLYVIGRLHTERKDCAKAIDYFERYLATKPGDTQAEAAQTEITKCKAQLPPPTDTGGGGGSTTTDTSAGTGDGGTPTPIATTTTATTDTSGSSMDKVGIGLLAGGVVAEGAAVLLYVKARNTQCGDPVCTTLTYEEYLDAEDKAKSLRLTSIIVAGVGAVLVGGGVYRFATHKRKSEPSLSFTPTRGGAALSFSGRF